MTLNASARPEPLAKRRRYRWLMYAALAIGSLGLIVAGRFDYHLLGLGFYWGGVLVFLGIWRGTSVQIYDERDVALERQASLWTLLLAGTVGIVAIPSAVTLDQLGYLTLQPLYVGVIYGYSGLFVAWGLVYLWLRFRP